MGAAEASQFPMLSSGLTNTMTQPPEQQMMEQMFQAMQQQIMSQQQPQMEQVPSGISPAHAFLSQLFGNLGSAIAQNPQYSAQTERAIQSTQEAHSAAEQRNLQRSNTYDLQRQGALLDLAMKRLDVGIAQAKQAKDAQTEQELTGMKAKLQDHRDQVDFEHDLAKIDETQKAESERERMRQAAEDRRAAMVDKRERDKMAQQAAKDKEKGTKTTDPFSLKDLTAAEARVGNKFGGKVKEKGKGPLGIGGPFGTKQVLEENPNKAEGLREVYVNGAISGGTAAPIAARKLAILVKNNEGITEPLVLAGRLKELGLSGSQLDLAMAAAGFPAKKK